jgi:hypothetical protein
MFIEDGLTVGSSGGAAVGVVTKLMDVHATLSIGVVASDIPCDGSWGGLRVLFEGDGSSDLRITSDGSNYICRTTWSASIRRR